MPEDGARRNFFLKTEHALPQEDNNDQTNDHKMRTLGVIIKSHARSNEFPFFIELISGRQFLFLGR